MGITARGHRREGRSSGAALGDSRGSLVVAEERKENWLTGIEDDSGGGHGGIGEQEILERDGWVGESWRSGMRLMRCSGGAPVVFI